MFFTITLYLSLGGQGDTRARWSSEASLLLLIERSFDEPEARLQALEALSHSTLLQLLWTRAPCEPKLLPRPELLRLLKGVYGGVDLGGEFFGGGSSMRKI